MAIQPQGGIAPGDLDPGFGQTGKVILDFPDANLLSARGMTITPAGRILIAGGASTPLNSFMVGCLTKDGNIDLSFGKNGSMIGKFLKRSSNGTSVTALADGKILVTGTHITSDQVLPAVCRLLPDGEFDPDFADGGTYAFQPITLPSGKKAIGIETPNQWRSSGSVGTQSTVLPDGKILISHPITVEGHGLLIQLTADGVLDRSFNGTGFTTVRYPHENVRTTLILSLRATKALDILKILVCGQTEIDGKPIQGLLARYGADGLPDTEFGSEGNGFIALDIKPLKVRVDDIVVGQDGRLVGFGAMAKSEAVKVSAIALGRTPDGAPDPNFNRGETVSIDLPLNSEWYSAGMTTEREKLVMTGTTYDENFGNNQVIVARYSRSGQLDKEFGRGKGWVSVDQALEPRLIVQDDDRILVCYPVRTPSGPTSAIVRLVN